MKKSLFTAIFLGMLGAAAQAQPSSISRNAAGTWQLLVDGKPYIMISGELHNSSASTAAYMDEEIWPAVEALGLNSIILPVAWEQIEPEEGRFDMSIVDELIAGAEKHDKRLAILWFGTWKNAESLYCPVWVKKDTKRFFRALTKDGQPCRAISPFCEEALKADRNAYVTLLRHIREVDRTGRVILMQIENEVGLLAMDYDYCKAARKFLKEQVPAELTAYMKSHDGKLTPYLSRSWESAGKKTRGSWTEVFGDGPEARSFALTWQYGRFMGEIAAAGKAVYALPAYVNAWLTDDAGEEPTTSYPNGGPVSRALDVWKAAAPAVDVLAPDIYRPNYKEILTWFHRDDNPLLIPESAPVPGRALYAFGAHSALCFAPFGIEDTASDGEMVGTMKLARELEPLILESQGSELMQAFLKEGAERDTTLVFGDTRLKVLYDAEGPSYGLVIRTAEDEFTVAGLGAKVIFLSADPAKSAQLGTVKEGGFDADGTWHTRRWLNGDETMSGNYLELAGRAVMGKPAPGIYKVTTFTMPKVFNGVMTHFGGEVGYF